MNTLHAIRIDESHDLLTGGTHNFLVLGTEEGHEIRIRIGDDDLQRVVNAIAGGPLDPDAVVKEMQRPVRHPRVAPETAPVAAPEQVPDEPQGMTEEEAVNTPIAWNELDDGVLSPVMKAAFFKLKAPMLMSPRAIMALVEDISSKFTAEDWREVTGQDVVVEPPAPAPPPAPAQVRAPVRNVQWADGTPMMPGSVSGRTVPKDEMGYPIVEGEVDPGEVVGHGSEVDEDGVGQL
jgi:hypothetical protein